MTPATPDTFTTSGASHPAVRLLALALIAFGLAGCSLISPPGSIGWFQAEQRHTWRPLDAHENCAALAARLNAGPLIVLVPGVAADGDELLQLLPALAPANPAAVWVYRWAPMGRRDEIATEFARGVSRLLACVPRLDGQLLVVAHSAGGIVAGYGAARIVVPERQRSKPAVYLMTVASPLAGMVNLPARADGAEMTRFAFDIASDIAVYPIAPEAMAAVHLRTAFPSDPVMKVRAHHRPNDPRVGIPGAHQVALPPQLTHDGALTYVAVKVGDGSWRQWFE